MMHYSDTDLFAIEVYLASEKLHSVHHHFFLCWLPC